MDRRQLYRDGPLAAATCAVLPVGSLSLGVEGGVFVTPFLAVAGCVGMVGVEVVLLRRPELTRRLWERRIVWGGVQLSCSVVAASRCGSGSRGPAPSRTSLYQDEIKLGVTNDAADTDRELLGHVLLPVAHEDDARKTAAALEPYAPGRVTALHVVEKGEGVPDKTPVAQSEEVAEASYAAVREVFPDAEDHTAYARDVVGAIFEAGAEVGATAVAYRSRDGNRLVQFLSGDKSLRLVTETDRPVIALPDSNTGG